MNKNEASRLASDYVVDRRQFIWLLLYVGMIHVSALFFQLQSGLQPASGGTPMDFFASVLLWLLSITSLQVAFMRLEGSWKFWFWITCTIGLALVAMDEMMELHERTSNLVGDDDYIKTLSWVITAVTLYALSRIELLPPLTKWALIYGFLFHSGWILVEVGDGDYFVLPFSLGALEWTEEFFELISLSGYFVGFFFLRDSIVKAEFTTGARSTVLPDREVTGGPHADRTKDTLI
jgi:hypothetical protein